MNAYPNQDWLARSNEETLYHLERQGRTGPGLVPFLGAGISTAFGFSDWKTLLIHAAPPSLASTVKGQLRKRHYTGAAETLLVGLGPDGFQSMVAASAGDSRLRTAVFDKGTVSLLPLLASGPVITTNFDRVLEFAFAANGATFESVISGPRPDLIVDALHGNRRVLIKLHGDWQDRVGRTFAQSDYEANYGTAQPKRKRELLDSTEELLFASRSLLFIGASLGPDRTVTVLKTVHQKYAGVRHFAIMSVPKKKSDFIKTERRLRSCGVLPLWYQVKDPGEHAAKVTELLANIVERISVQSVAEESAVSPECASTPPPRVQPSPRRKPKLKPRLDRFKAQLDRAARLIEDGRLTFFLGAAIHYPTDLMAKEFYEQLAQIFEPEATDNELEAMAQYIADRHGRENLYAEIRKLLERTHFVPRNTHEMFAAWDSFKTSRGVRPPYPLVFTTNYDDILERRLTAAKVPFHLLHYQADGPHRGLFYHQTPKNALRLIERPRNIRELSGDGFIVVKLNGGFDCQGRIPESYSTTRLDYWDLAARIPGVLPAFIQEKLSASPLLFIGHGLAMPDVEALIRFAHKQHPGPRSWAVVKKVTNIAYWRQCGVEILNTSVHLYINKLHARLAGKAPRGRGSAKGRR
ncbi:MAG: SIR2 family protein [Pyrinomonadaceae bacterium]